MLVATTINMISVISAVTASRPLSAPEACRAAIMTDRLERSVQGGFYESRQKEHSVSETLPGEHMIDAESRANKRQQGQRAVELHVAARLENLAMLRTLVGAIGTFEDLDFDAVADLRLAVDEVCTRLIRSATPDATLVVIVDPRDDELVVEASAACDTHDVVAPGSFSWHVLTSLADDVQTFHDGRDPDESGSVFGITLTARRAASSR
jgi:anti-sigma regulatory factor (Ser/Thr protein kinase)